jgi:hypothetical protein
VERSDEYQRQLVVAHEAFAHLMKQMNEKADEAKKAEV